MEQDDRGKAEQAEQVVGELRGVKQHMQLFMNDLDNLISAWERNIERVECCKVTMDDSEFELHKEQPGRAGIMKDLSLLSEQALQEASWRLQQIKSRHYRKEVLRVVEVMEERIEAKITLDFLASEVMMNVSYLCRVFKQDTGKSMVQYMNDLKIQKALEWLKLPNARIKDVSAAVGIDNPFYFNRLFKKTLGLSPTEYRKKMFTK